MDKVLDCFAKAKAAVESMKEGPVGGEKSQAIMGLVGMMLDQERFEWRDRMPRPIFAESTQMQGKVPCGQEASGGR